ncbi:unnamed protein product [Dovyalis caffra]|uniref:AMP deaminase n=1 Tax=Dovyalis caffra TaxID=77055 RepID=A0AAV1RBR0_9ROSI|nr:unnamed protein product [Dovyalis caffra]
MIRECLDLRNSYVYAENVAPWTKQAVEESTASGENTNLLEPSFGLVLLTKFRLHLFINADRKSLVQKSAPHRDFNNIRKKNLLRFIKSKLRKEPDEIVIFRDGKYVTLKEIFESLPRLYNVYKQIGTVNSFQTILDNVFIPLFEVTINPSSHPQLHVFLMQVVGLDIVDDESRPQRRPTKHMPKPAEWTNEFNPAYSYYAYYCYGNLYTLLKAADMDHLAAAFLLCNNRSHGRGLNGSLSTDHPLQIHLTKEPLVEEYSVAAKVRKLSACDLCEIVRNSVYQSGFSHVAKLHWLGSKYFLRGPEGNNIHKTNVPNIRIGFRHETWKEEMQYVFLGMAKFPEEIEF